MKTLFIGGPGRSGTSFVADRLSKHPSVCAFRGVELKFFTEKNGLLDLWHALGERYSPNRAIVAVQQFRRMVDALITGQYGQPGLDQVADAKAWRAAFDRFLAGFMDATHPMPTDSAAFSRATRTLLKDVFDLANDRDAGEYKYFLEKTPHSLLALDFLDQIAPHATFLHVMRDPRSIAHSLLGMRWGPDTPEACAAWVASYCSSWVRTRAKAAELGLNVRMVFIETVAQSPGQCAQHLCDTLGLEGQDDLFLGRVSEVVEIRRRCNLLMI